MSKAFLFLLLILSACKPAPNASSPLSKIQTLSGFEAADQFGAKVDWGGDVNGDGWDDLLIGAPGAASGTGKTYLYYGNEKAYEAKPAWVKQGEAIQDGFGKVVAGLGDVNGDGFDDVFMDASESDAGGKESGKAYVFMGSAKGLEEQPAWSAQGGMVDEHFGDCAASAGDLNGDGYMDLAVGAYGFDAYRGRALVYLGGPRGLKAKADWEFRGEGKGDWFGYGIGPAGDINGDGYDDLILGAKNNASGATHGGKVYLFFGGPKGLASKAAWTQAGSVAAGLYGNRVTGAGDVDGDGWQDLLVGAPQEGGGAGAAYVYFGGPKGPDGRVQKYHGQHPRERIGYGVAPAGDLNGDGMDDWMAGGNGFSNESGTVKTFLGGSGPAHVMQSFDDDKVGSLLGHFQGLAGTRDSGPLLFISRPGAGMKAEWPGRVELWSAPQADPRRRSWQVSQGTAFSRLPSRLWHRAGEPLRLKALGVDDAGAMMQVALLEPGQALKDAGRLTLGSDGILDLGPSLDKIKASRVRLAFVYRKDEKEFFYQVSGGRLSISAFVSKVPAQQGMLLH